MTDQPNELLEVSEAARMAGISAASIRRAADLGALPVAGKTATGRRFYTRSAVLAFAEERSRRLEAAREHGRQQALATIRARQAGRPTADLMASAAALGHPVPEAALALGEATAAMLEPLREEAQAQAEGAAEVLRESSSASARDR